MFDVIPSMQCGSVELKLDTPKIMAIVNITPDSFSDGGKLSTVQQAIEFALQQIELGADILDIGGESTRPDANEISVQEELARVIPVIEGLRGKIRIPISIDTSKPEVMRAAVAAGAGLINDVYALRQEGALEAAAELNVPVCIMHMLGKPKTMQQEVRYEDVLVQVRQFLTERIFACEMAGIAKKNIIIDPGFGFGKHLEHNLKLLANLDYFKQLGVPVLAGMSRKSMIGLMTGRNLEQRMVGSVAAAMLAVQNGASIIRVHDVAESKDALAVLSAVSAYKTKTAEKSNKPSILWPDED